MASPDVEVGSDCAESVQADMIIDVHVPGSVQEERPKPRAEPRAATSKTRLSWAWDPQQEEEVASNASGFDSKEDMALHLQDTHEDTLAVAGGDPEAVLHFQAIVAVAGVDEKQAVNSPKSKNRSSMRRACLAGALASSVLCSAAIVAWISLGGAAGTEADTVAVLHVTGQDLDDAEVHAVFERMKAGEKNLSMEVIDSELGNSTVSLAVESFEFNVSEHAQVVLLINEETGGFPIDENTSIKAVVCESDGIVEYGCKLDAALPRQLGFWSKYGTGIIIVGVVTAVVIAGVLLLPAAAGASAAAGSGSAVSSGFVSATSSGFVSATSSGFVAAGSTKAVVATVAVPAAESTALVLTKAAVGGAASGAASAGVTAAVNSGCFPARAIVQALDGMRAIKNLSIGTLLMTSQGYAPMFLSGHHDASTITTMVQFTTASNHTLAVTPDHYLPLPGGAYKSAGQVSVGDELIVQSGDGFVPSRVEAKGHVHLQGLFNPFTTTGDLVVDGVLASCHSAWFLEGHLSEEYIVPIYQRIFQSLVLLYTLAPGWFDRFASEFADDDRALSDAGVVNVAKTAFVSLLRSIFG